MKIKELIDLLKAFVKTVTVEDQKLEILDSEISIELAQLILQYYNMSESQVNWLSEEVEIFRDYSRLLKKENFDLMDEIAELEESNKETKLVFTDNTGVLN
jgi:hypothetical protein